MKLSYAGLQDKAAFEAAGIVLPKYDWKQMAEYTAWRQDVYDGGHTPSTVRLYLLLKSRLISSSSRSSRVSWERMAAVFTGLNIITMTDLQVLTERFFVDIMKAIHHLL